MRAQPDTEHHRAGHDALVKNSLIASEDVIRHVGMHIHHQGVELHRLALRDCPTDGPDPLTDLDVLVVQVLGVPDRDRPVLGDVRIRISSLLPKNSSAI